MPPRLWRFAVMVSDMDALLRVGVGAPIRAPRDAKRWKSSVGAGEALLAIHLRGIEHPFVIAEGERQRRIGPAAHNGAIEARSPPGVAGAGAGLIDLKPQHVLVAVDAYLGDLHNVARGLAFLPKRLT